MSAGRFHFPPGRCRCLLGWLVVWVFCLFGLLVFALCGCVVVFAVSVAFFFGFLFNDQGDVLRSSHIRCDQLVAPLR